MASIDQLQAFVSAAEQGSFSAAARQLGKAQSAISHAIALLEIDLDLSLFDRSLRSPTLTADGEALLVYARGVLQSHSDFQARAVSLGPNADTRVCLALEQNISTRWILPLLATFAERYPQVELEFLDPGRADVAELMRSGRADIGVMIEQEGYPQGFRFRGIGHSAMLAVCHPDHPLAKLKQVSHLQLRQHRQLIGHSLNASDTSYQREVYSPQLWLSQSPHVIVELLSQNLGWALVHRDVAGPALESGELCAIDLGFQRGAVIMGIDVVWSEQRPLGAAGQWLLEQLLAFHLKPDR